MEKEILENTIKVLLDKEKNLKKNIKESKSDIDEFKKVELLKLQNEIKELKIVFKKEFGVKYKIFHKKEVQLKSLVSESELEGITPIKKIIESKNQNVQQNAGKKTDELLEFLEQQEKEKPEKQKISKGKIERDMKLQLFLLSLHEK